ncbi:MAG: hypothetical protein RBS78_08655 [Coriobacteriia bacterium]|jgi:hypothetical protein|nr:hypothetical protein [Coriobacteriia bacterium]
MKKTLFVFALAIVLVLSFSSIAFAKYAGYAYNNPVPPSTDPNPTPGYLSWTGANVISAQQNGGTSANGSTAHGGYAVNTTKCAVCHSVHRAASDLSAAGVGSYWKLTPGGQACVACHTPSGSNPVSTALVEWPSTYSDGGPHSSFSCLGSCHGSVHGAVASEYGAVAAWNLTSINDPAIAAAFTAGNEYTAADSLNNDPIRNSALQPRGIITDETFRDFNLPSTVQGSVSQRAMRAMATGYTCGRSGCHSSSQFVVNKKGYGELRASDPRASSTLDKVMTGHQTNLIYGCPPCHMNDLAGGLDNSAIGRDSTCALCHDAVGKATNSSAFPHANRNITFVELDQNANETDVAVDNVTYPSLWMYAGDATSRDASGKPALTPNPATTLYRTRTLIMNASGWHEGQSGNINDGVCLKCHADQYNSNMMARNAGHNIGAVRGWLTGAGTPSPNTSLNFAEK